MKKIIVSMVASAVAVTLVACGKTDVLDLVNKAENYMATERVGSNESSVSYSIYTEFAEAENTYFVTMSVDVERVLEMFKDAKSEKAAMLGAAVAINNLDHNNTEVVEKDLDIIRQELDEIFEKSGVQVVTQFKDQDDKITIYE